MADSVTSKVRNLLGGENFPECESPSLRLEKYVQLPEKVWINGKEKDIHTKNEEICHVVKCHEKYAKPVPFFEPANSVPVITKLRSRLIVNQSGGILENAGLCLHPHFGAPYIPGSAVKGIARHAAWCEWNEEADETEKKNIAERIAAVFGYPTNDDGLDAFLAAHGWKDKSGSVVFMPACPCDLQGNPSSGALAVDILTPHGGNDWTDPVPNPFPVVSKDVFFMFVVCPSGPNGTAHLGDAICWLKKGLSENGIGAKTAAGYGAFSISGEADPSGVKTYALKLVSPAFLRGAEGDEGALRVSSLRGVLRYWWRIVFGSVLSSKNLDELETRVWGGAGNIPTASQIVLRLVPVVDSRCVSFDKEVFARKLPRRFQVEKPKRKVITAPGLAYASYGMDDSGRRRKVVLPGAEWRLEASFRPRDGVSEKTLADHLDLALKALCTFGGVGSKSRKGFGSLDCGEELDLENQSLWEDIMMAVQPFGMEPDFDKAGEYSLLVGQPLSIPVETDSPLAVIDRIGCSLKTTAESFKHKPEKAAAGLPRKIHGPKDERLPHQRGKWDPPEVLHPDGDIPRSARRFASPIFIHVALRSDGKLKVNAMDFPSGLVRPEAVSRNILKCYREGLKQILSDTDWT